MDRPVRQYEAQIHGQMVTVKVFPGATVLGNSGLTKPRFTKGRSSGAMHIARERDLKLTRP